MVHKKMSKSIKFIEDRSHFKNLTLNMIREKYKEPEISFKPEPVAKVTQIGDKNLSHLATKSNYNPENTLT